MPLSIYVLRDGVTREQAATAALEIASSAYLLRRGEVVYHGPAARLRDDVDALHGAYFGCAHVLSFVHHRRRSFAFPQASLSLVVVVPQG